MHRRDQRGSAAGGEGEGPGLLARLLECHTRIREMLAMGEAIAQLGSAEETMAAAERLGRYFTRGLPFHTRDEEESILPRLVAGAPELAGALDRMHRGHLAYEPLVREVVAACRDLVDAPAHWEELRADVAVAATALAPVMAAHLLEEERDVLPGIERLGADVQARILEEMDARRTSGR